MQPPLNIQPQAIPPICAYCGYEIAHSPVQYHEHFFCTQRCYETFEKGDRPFTGSRADKWFNTDVDALDSLLPQGIPTNSFVLLAGETGIRHRGMQTELVWRALQRDEQAIVISFVDPPIAIAEHFLTFGWNVLPYLEDDRLHIIDCFTNSLRDKHQTPTHQTNWNSFLRGFLEETVTVIQDPADLHTIEHKLHERLESVDMRKQGLVVLDSVNEIDKQGREFETEKMVKEVGGDVCSRKFVPLFASVTKTESGMLTDNYSYLFDGIIEMRHTESLLPGVRLKQLSIRKMDGVLYKPHWVTYEAMGSNGFRLFSPTTEFGTIYGWDQPVGHGESNQHLP